MSAPSKNNQNSQPKGGKKKKKSGNAQKVPTQTTMPKKAIPLASTTQFVAMAPKMTFGNKSRRIVHRELVSSVPSGPNDNYLVVASYALNPGISNTFVWLSTQALGWEQYKFHSLRFRFITRVSATTSGSVLMIPDYDAADASPSSEFVASTYEDTREDVVWKDQVCVLDPKGLSGLYDRHFIRTGSLGANLDIKTYDVGSLFIAVVGTGAAPGLIGKLWVEYDVEFFKPQLPPNGVSDIYGGTITPGGAMSAANPLGTGAGISANALGVAVDTLSRVTISNPGTYLFTAGAAGSGITGGMAQSLISGIATNIHNYGSVNSAGTYSQAESAWNVTGVPAVFQNTVAAATTITGGALNIGLAPQGSLV